MKNTKTKIAYAVANLLGLNVVNIPLSQEPASSLLGTFRMFSEEEIQENASRRLKR